MTEYPKELKDEHSRIAQNGIEYEKSEYDNRRNLKYRTIGVISFFTGWAIMSFVFEFGHFIIPVMFIPIQIYLYGYFMKKSDHRLKIHKDSMNKLEEMGKEFYDTKPDERYT